MTITYVLLLLLLLSLSLPFSESTDYHFDFVIYCATPAGIIAAVSASQYAASIGTSLTIAILEPSTDIGGMMAAGGIGLRDIGTEDTLEYTLAAVWTRLNAQHYNVSYRVYQPDMWIATESFQAMLDQARNVSVFTESALQEVEGVEKQGTRITSLTTVAGDVFYGGVFMDASYEGDLMIGAGVSFTYGRESAQHYGESLAGVQKYTSFSNFKADYPVNATVSSDDPTLVPWVDPEPLAAVGSADGRMMGYSYRLCITSNAAKSTPFPEPTNYNRTSYLLLQRYIDSLVDSKQYPNGPPLGFLVDILDYRNYPPADKWDLCDSSSAFTSDVINLNKYYVTASYRQRALIAQQHQDYLLGMLWYLSWDSEVPEATRNSTKRMGLCADQWNDTQHIPPQLYIREAARLVNDHVITEVNLRTGKCLDDSIALGSWGWDTHVVSRTAVWDATKTRLIVQNEGQFVGSIPGNGSVYEIGYSATVPRESEASNLYVPVCMAASHVTYSSLRVEPHFMFIAESLGIATVVALQQKSTVQAVNVTIVQQALAKRNVQIHHHGYKCATESRVVSDE